MSGEVWTIIGVGAALAALILRLAGRVDAMGDKLAALGERVAGIEGFLRGRESRKPDGESIAS